MNSNLFYQVMFHYRISWRRSSGDNFCNDTTIQLGSLQGSGFLQRLSPSGHNIGILEYQCTGFDADEDWTTGRYSMTYRPNVTHFTAG